MTRDMEKTVEEIRDTVLPEFKRLSPKAKSGTFTLDNGLCVTLTSYSSRSEWKIHCEGCAANPIVTVDDSWYSASSLRHPFTEMTFRLAYKLLDLEARDAVQAERENYKALEILMIQRNEQINAERARAAKLVDALEEIHAKATVVPDRLPLHDYTTEKNEDCYLPKAFIDSLGDLEALIAAHKEGGLQG